jgi:hypothetical protein
VTDHLTVRVPWHDQRWNGRVCQAPSRNTFCLDLKRIRLEKDDAVSVFNGPDPDVRMVQSPDAEAEVIASCSGNAPGRASHPRKLASS